MPYNAGFSVNEANVQNWSGLIHMLYERVGSEEAMIEIIDKVINSQHLNIRQALSQSYLDSKLDDAETHPSFTGIALLVAI